MAQNYVIYLWFRIYVFVYSETMTTLSFYSSFLSPLKNHIFKKNCVYLHVKYLIIPFVFFRQSVEGKNLFTKVSIQGCTSK